MQRPARGFAIRVGPTTRHPKGVGMTEGGEPGRSSATPSVAVATGARVVIVDDEIVNVTLLERILHSIGVTHTSRVTDPREAVTRILDVGADLVLLDLHMPALDGRSVLAQLRARLPADEYLPVLVLTADGTMDARDGALQAGAHDFLTKPLDYTEVTLRVRNLLETRALHRDLRQHNTRLQAALDAHAEDERRAVEEQQARTARIDTALEPDVLHMVYQPVVDLHRGAPVGFEALARFDCEPRRPPNEWFDEASMIGRGAELELVAARAAIEAIPRLPTGTFMSINLSPAVVMLPQTAALFDGVDRHRVVLELTEHTRVDDYALLLAAMGALQAGGLRVAVDDTGNGYAGLAHLLQLRPQVIKLDRALTGGVDADPARRALATGLVTFAAEIGSTIVAEGIETASELETLRDLGILWGQGYHLGRPGPLQTAAAAPDMGP